MSPKFKLKDNLPKHYRKGFLTKISRQTVLGKSLNATFASIINDAGGIDNQTIGTLMLAERLTFLDSMLREFERKIIEDPVKEGELVTRWTKCVSTMNGIIKTLGLDKKTTDDIFDALYADDPEDSPQDPADNATDPAEAPKVEHDKDVDEPSKPLDAKPEPRRPVVDLGPDEDEDDEDEPDDWDL